MFVQVIQGRAGDAPGLRKQLERWRDELMPGAEGFLGSTGGIADDGEFISIARFESESAARRNSDRPEQGQWWAETERYLDGEARFYDSTEITTTLGGGSDEAGFVQFLQGTVRDKARLRELDEEFEDRAPQIRPDFLGGVTAWQGDDFTQANYFRSEAEARAGESSGEMQETAPEFLKLIDNVKWIDIREPILLSK